MTLNASGVISIGGSTTGQSINLELGRSATTSSSLNETALRCLAGVASGTISLSNFYGKPANPTVGVYYGGETCNNLIHNPSQAVTRLNACGSQIGSVTYVGNTFGGGGAQIGSNAVYYNYAYLIPQQRVTRINSSGALVGSETSVGTTRGIFAGAKVGSNGLYYGGLIGCSYTTLTTRINACGALAASETSVGTGRRVNAGATVGGNGLFYGGGARTTRINACGAMVGSETVVGTNRCGMGGANVGGNGLFFAGQEGTWNRATRINSCAALVGETLVGTMGRVWVAGASIGANGVYFGGSYTNVVTRINSSGALVGSEPNLSNCSNLGRSSQVGVGL